MSCVCVCVLFLLQFAFMLNAAVPKLHLFRYPLLVISGNYLCYWCSDVHFFSLFGWYACEHTLFAVMFLKTCYMKFLAAYTHRYFFFYQTIRLFLIIATISLQPFSFLFRLSSCIFCSWLCIYSSISWEVFSLKRLTVLCTNSSISYTSDVKQSDLNCLKRCDFISNVFYIARKIFQFESNDWKSLEQPRYETKSGKLINQNKIKLFNRMLD